MFARILVPLDGSEFAERALAPAEELSRLTGARLHLIRVVDLSQANYGMALAYSTLPAQVFATELEEARTYLDGVRQSLISRGHAVTTEVRRGKSAREIAAATRPGDMVVMTTHGRAGATRWLFGSVAEDVVRHVAVPVLLVRLEPEPKAPTGKRVRRRVSLPGFAAASNA
jgi:nucleotide-binding universal stress UspA family protein